MWMSSRQSTMVELMSETPAPSHSVTARRLSKVGARSMTASNVSARSRA